MNAGIRKLPLTLILLLLAAAGGLTIYNLTQQLPPAQWARALSAPDIDDVRQRAHRAQRKTTKKHRVAQAAAPSPRRRL